MKAKTINPWSVFVIGALSIMGVINFFLFKTAAGVSRSTYVDSPYEEGLAYQKHIDAETRFKNLGFSSEARLTGTKSPEEYTLTFRLKSKEGQAVESARIIASVTRADSPAFDQKRELLLRNGEYETTINGPAGVWQAQFIVLLNDIKLETNSELRTPQE